MFERFLERVSVSEYSEKFVVKGVMLIAAIVGLDTRSTMDLDTTLRNLSMTEEQISAALHYICKIDLNDDVSFEIKSVAPIRKDDVYGGYCVGLDAIYDTIYDTIVTLPSIDVSTGDIITPEAVKYKFSGIFDEDVKITLWGYNIETVMAEKVETILSRGVFTTRPRDFYDVYILGTTQKYDRGFFKEALKATAMHRGSLEKIVDVGGIMEQISSNKDLKNMWVKYQKKFAYARGISYENIMEMLGTLILESDMK